MSSSPQTQERAAAKEGGYAQAVQSPEAADAGIGVSAGGVGSNPSVNASAGAGASPQQPGGDQQQQQNQAPDLSAALSTIGLGMGMSSSHPAHVVSGVRKSLGSLMQGTIATVVSVVALPVVGTKLGYNSGGATGAVIGLTAGTLIGTLAGVCIAVSTVTQSASSLLYGISRTPRAIVESMGGKDWDELSEEWVLGDLKEEARTFLAMSDSEYLSILQAAGGDPAKVFSALERSHATAQALAGNASGAQAGSASASSSDTTAAAAAAARHRPARAVHDLTLYTALEIGPEATAAEIKKAYYVQARKSHPDKHPNDPSAQRRFQQIGEAYLVLSDPRTRDIYDMRGAEVATKGIDTFAITALYAMLFGSDKFDALIGELQLAQQIKAATDAGHAGAAGEAGGAGATDHAANISKLLPFHQRKREIQLAVTLAEKLATYVSQGGGDVAAETLKAAAQVEAKELAGVPLGAALLSVIGECYITAAKSELSSLHSMWGYVKSGVDVIADFWGVVCMGTGTAFRAMGLKSLYSDAEDKLRGVDAAAGMTEEQCAASAEKRAQSGGPFAAASMQASNGAITPEDKEKMRAHTKRTVHSGVRLLWKITTQDVKTTLQAVLTKVLHDHSQSKEARQLRAEGLLVLGQAYVQESISAHTEPGSKSKGTRKLGIDSLVEQLGLQTGLFGDEPAEFSASPLSEESGDKQEQEQQQEEDKWWTSDAGLQRVFSACATFSVRELRAHITNVHGNSADCLEKADLVQRLQRLILERSSDALLGQLAAAAALREERRGEDDFDPLVAASRAAIESERERLVELILKK